MFPPVTTRWNQQPLIPIQLFLPDGVNLQYAAAIKNMLNLMGNCWCISDPAHMEEIIASGQADLIAMARQTLADPDLPLKARSGRDDEIRKCLRCSECFGSVGKHRIFYCSINPVIGYEKESRYLPPVRNKKQVLVVGGGVAGMQAALTAAERGHRVILCEKSDKLGGVCAVKKSALKAKIKTYLDLQAHLLKKQGWRCGCRLETPQLAKTIKPDVIIAAPGARPVVPQIKGINLPHVLGAEDIFLQPEKTGKTAVILGGGLVGVELGIYLAQEGRSVTIIEKLPELSIDKFSLHTLALRDQIKKLGIKIYTSTSAREITGTAVLADSPAGKLELPAETVIYAVGQQPLREEALALAQCAPEFYQIGDCLTPKNILAATQAANTLANNLGR